MKFDYKAEDLIIKPYKSESPVYVRKQKGHYQRIRQLTGLAFVLLFILVPWINFQGHQAILLDIGKQQFHVFSQTFFPQDFTLLAGLLIVSCYLLFFITTWLGRIWCGYTCPQTVWTFSFIWVEEWLEGSRNQRIKRDKQPTTLDTFARKSAKHLIWGLMAFLTATTFISYFLPARALYVDFFQWQWDGLTTFWVLFFAVCTYGNAGFLREKMCIYMCPYSRFQSAMFDKNTLLVAYDKLRGENRGRRKRKEDPKVLGLGDCVDCNLCVEVCPVGIDIRNGLQYECINCGACADACDQTMTQFNYAKGLISYTSENALLGKKAKLLRPKIIGYGILSILAMLFMVYTVQVRVPIEFSVLRDRGALFQLDFQDNVTNSYLLKITNKSKIDRQFDISVLNNNVTLSVADHILIKGGEIASVPVHLTMTPEEVTERVSEVSLQVSVHDLPEVKAITVTKFFSN
ncbi:cytochrome c oxidase accessory protein CcoG [Colwellia sp. M166]|uniref:cytochrome c oxidase accessory protein CcoG n=1 Tax=Colwellia sp. M166 TaxID=2583805 RepID=UPI00211DD201|nr:cytochrome c oxidase accessory protein CcoG [Colwellia sp. M166]UUO23381.1 cytochrome c oxidase accessory protein CcoG [Colwellia sp. M166]|tara:strand:+ start:26801 stop:28180 length:1380 start_codon:yes stop_codon:yes gene_type:complete